ncbi:MAG: AI-2E family transporter, partial [Bacteroidota bacterium]
MRHKLEFPFYAQLAFILISLSVIFTFLYLAQGILIPILLALLFAILLRPVVCFFNRRLKFPHVIAVMASVVVFVMVIGGIIFFVSWKISDMASDLDQIKTNLNIHYHNIQHWIKQKFDISYTQQQRYIQQASKENIHGSEIIGATMGSFTDVLLNFVLIPIYIFLFLLYRNLFLQFLSKLFKAEHQFKLREILTHVKTAIQSYLVGLLTEVLIVSTLTSVGFMIIGVQYPILLGVITGVLNMIPYIGILVAGGISILATLTSTADVSVILGVVTVNAVVQLIDNNLLVPLVVSSKVKINAFVSIVAIIIGGALGGVAGMFLAIPLIAIIKVVFDRIESFEPWGFLMGDDLPKVYKWGGIKLTHYDAGDAKEEK